MKLFAAHALAAAAAATTSAAILRMQLRFSCRWREGKLPGRVRYMSCHDVYAMLMRGRTALKEGLLTSLRHSLAAARAHSSLIRYLVYIRGSE